MSCTEVRDGSQKPEETPPHLCAAPFGAWSGPSSPASPAKVDKGFSSLRPRPASGHAAVVTARQQKSMPGTAVPFLGDDMTLQLSDFSHYGAPKLVLPASDTGGLPQPAKLGDRESPAAAASPSQPPPKRSSTTTGVTTSPHLGISPRSVFLSPSNSATKLLPYNQCHDNTAFDVEKDSHPYLGVPEGAASTSDRPSRRQTADHAEDKKPPAVHITHKIDAFALREKPSTMVGGIMTVFVIAAVIAYTVYTTYAWLSRPWINNSASQWTYLSGPWPLRARCRAASGCWVSNHVTPKWAGVTVPASQGECVYMRPGDVTVFNITFSNNPNEGLSAIFIPGKSDTMVLPPGSEQAGDIPNYFGLELESIIVWPDLTVAVDGVTSLMMPVGGGLNLLFLVETTNGSASGRGAFRREWYPTQVANINNRVETSIVEDATACGVAQFNSSWAHARVRLTADYAQVTVTRDALWLVVWGAVGGAMGLFMQLGAVLVSIISVLLVMASRKNDSEP